MDSDQFGSQIMFHAAAMHTREVHGRLENVEFSWAGQAFRLGRYPIHFHMNGDVSGSYVKLVSNDFIVLSEPRFSFLPPTPL